MSKPIKLQTSSEQEQSRQSFNIESQAQKLSIKALRSAQSVLDAEILSSLQKKYEECVLQDKGMVDFLQFMIYSMFNWIDRLQQTFEMDVVQEDYQVLEEAAQKSEAEVRKHIRIEQQLKIYLDSLQEKVEDLQRRLAIEQLKYSQLFESMKEIDEQRKELQKKISKIEDGKNSRAEQIKDKSKSQSNYSTINDQLYKDYFGPRKTKVNKGRHVIDKINDRSRKLSSNQKSGGNLHFVDGPIQINLSNNIVVSKKSSYDQNLTKGQPASHNSSIRQLTKTVNMKHQALTAIQRRPNRKISKYKTQAGENQEKKECRSNSVCN